MLGAAHEYMHAASMTASAIKRPDVVSPCDPHKQLVLQRGALLNTKTHWHIKSFLLVCQSIVQQLQLRIIINLSTQAVALSRLFLNMSVHVREFSSSPLRISKGRPNSTKYSKSSCKILLELCVLYVHGRTQELDGSAVKKTQTILQLIEKGVGSRDS